MIKCDKPNIQIQGKPADVFIEVGLIIKHSYEAGVNRDGILTDLICAVMKDSTDSLEIIKALSKPNLPKE